MHGEAAIWIGRLVRGVFRRSASTYVVKTVKRWRKSTECREREFRMAGRKKIRPRNRIDASETLIGFCCRFSPSNQCCIIFLCQ